MNHRNWLAMGSLFQETFLFSLHPLKLALSYLPLNFPHLVIEQKILGKSPKAVSKIFITFYFPVQDNLFLKSQFWTPASRCRFVAIFNKLSVIAHPLSFHNN
jgi:hypothetical protein